MEKIRKNFPALSSITGFSAKKEDAIEIISKGNPAYIGPGYILTAISGNGRREWLCNVKDEEEAKQINELFQAIYQSGVNEGRRNVLSSVH